MVTRGAAATGTKERVLQAGIRLWIDTEPAVLFGGMNVSRLAKAAGITRATFYSYWSTTQEFLDDLAEYIAGQGPIRVDAEFTQALTQLSLGDDGVAEGFLALCRQVFNDLKADPGLRLRLGMLAKMDDPVVAAKLRAQYLAAEAQQVELYDRWQERWGRAPRPPLDQAQLTAVFTALLEGYAARSVVDPDLATPELYAYVAAVMLLVLTTTLDNTRDLPTLISMMDRWPEEGERIRARERGVDDLRRPLPHAVHDVDPLELTKEARRAMAYRPWGELSLETVADLARVEPSAIINLFGSKHGLGIAIFQLQAREAFDALPPEPDPLARLRMLLATAAEILRRSPAVTQSVMLVFAGMADAPAPGAITWDATPDIFAAVSEAQAAGQLSDEVADTEISATLLRMILTQMTPIYANGLGRDCDSIELFLRGLGAAPSPTGTIAAPPAGQRRPLIPGSWAAAERRQEAARLNRDVPGTSPQDV